MDALTALDPVVIGLAAVAATIVLARRFQGQGSTDGWVARASASSVPLPTWGIIAALFLSGILYIELIPASRGESVPVAAVVLLCLVFGLTAFASIAATFGVGRAWWSLLVGVAFIAVALVTPAAVPAVVGAVLGLAPLLLGAGFLVFRRNASRH
jgi:hypothetical protein